MLILNAEEVRQTLPMPAVIGGMKQAYAALSQGDAVIPLRARLPIEPRSAAALFMPAYVPDNALAIKVVTLFPHNPPAGMPLIHAAVLVMDAHTGQMLALLEGGTLTAIRTGAGAGAATDLLARRDARVAAIFGAGVQAGAQLEAICAVRQLEQVRIYSPSPARVKAFIEAHQPRVSAKLTGSASPREAIQHADIVCAATTSTTPVFADTDLAPGVHINGVGSYTPGMIEIPPETVARAAVFVDSVEACRAEAGEIIRAVELGKRWEQVTEIGACFAGGQPGRASHEQVTFFKSVGVAVQDAVAAQIALANARTLGLGQTVDW
jgi:ornithine cyclodeaminase